MFFCAIKHVLGLSGVFISTVLVPAMSEVVISSASAGLRAEIDSLANDFFSGDVPKHFLHNKSFIFIFKALLEIGATFCFQTNAVSH